MLFVSLVKREVSPAVLPATVYFLVVNPTIANAGSTVNVLLST
jgi:hypothetical protein